MKTFILLTLALVLYPFVTSAQQEPEILYYQFDETGTTVTNQASTPPAGTNTAAIVGGLTQGGQGLCGTALVGIGGSSNTNYVNTGWNTNLGTGAWTIAFWTNNIPASATLFYQFGDATAGSFRCFTNGVAGAGNFILRGPVTDVPCPGCAPTGNNPSMTAFVYDPLAGDIKAYHNGVLVNTVPQGALNIAGSDFRVGGYSGSTGIGSGQLMDEFRVYNRALDAMEIMNTYNACLPLFVGPNDVGVLSVDEPNVFCADTQNVVVTIRNYGNNIIDSCMVNWAIDAVPQTPVMFYGALDTLNGTGSNTAQVTLGSAYFAPLTPYTIDAWTSMPNGVADTVNVNDSISSIVQGALSGNFTIGGVSPDYASFTDAANALNSFGVCGPVVFDVRSGTYTEQMQLDQIPGSSSTNTITFRSEAGHRDSVLLTFAAFDANSNYTVLFNGADFVTLEQMTLENTGTTFSHVLEYGGQANSNTVWDCRVSAGLSTTTSTNRVAIFSNTSEDHNNVFRDNTIEGGSYSFYYQGESTNDLDSGTVIENNMLLNPYYQWIRLDYQNSPIVRGNHFSSNSAYTGSMYGIYLNYADNNMEVSHNIIEGDNVNSFYGLYIINCDGAPNNYSNVFNNMITTGGVGSTSTCYGIYMSNSGNLNLFGNNVLARGDGTSTRSFYGTGGGNVKVYNNNFATSSPGYGVYVSNPYTVIEMDHNNIYAPNGNAGFFNGDQLTLADWQNASGYDANSVSVNPQYHSELDLHVCNDTLDGAGIAWPLLTTDVDGQPRGTVPDIGADEFTPVSVGGVLGADLSLCIGESADLWVDSPNDTILWSTGDTMQMITVSTPGTYFVDVTGACGTVSDTIEVSASNETYINYLIADTTSFCTGDTVTLSSSMSADSYLWSTGDTTASITVTSGGNYTLDIADGCGSGTEAITINENSAPTAGFTSTNSYLTAIFTNTSSGTNATYSWDFGDGNSSNLENPAHIYAGLGSYVVTLTVTNECGTDVYVDTVMFSVGLEEQLSSGSVEVYPNPSSGMITLDLDMVTGGKVDVSVRNVLGQTIQTLTPGYVSGKHSEQINLTNAQPGVYFIQVSANDESVARKVVIH